MFNFDLLIVIDLLKGFVIKLLAGRVSKCPVNAHFLKKFDQNLLINNLL